jgi:hypothetical protein
MGRRGLIFGTSWETESSGSFGKEALFLGFHPETCTLTDLVQGVKIPLENRHQYAK